MARLRLVKIHISTLGGGYTTGVSTVGSEQRMKGNMTCWWGCISSRKSHGDRMGVGDAVEAGGIMGY